MPILFLVDGRRVAVEDDGASLLEVLRDRLGVRGPKDGCSPQGQCGCCTVLIDGAPRVACVTPMRRVEGREVTTIDGLPAPLRDAWAGAFCASGASQCGFCTPGIIMRLAASSGLQPPGPSLTEAAVEEALLAHLCRCTGWRTVVEAATRPGDPSQSTPRDFAAAEARATLEGGVVQRVGPEVALGLAGFAEDSAPAGALVAVPDGDGGWSTGNTLTAARSRAGKRQGRRSTRHVPQPLDLPPGDWALTLRTAWVEPAYLEPDASWCVPGGEPASPLANGGAFGGKANSVAPSAAKQLAEVHGRPVRVVLAREDVVRVGPKRPPIAAGVRADGTGVIRVVRTPGIAAAIAAVAPGLTVEEVDIAGPATSAAIRGAGWMEAAVLLAALPAATDASAPTATDVTAGTMAPPGTRDGRAEVMAPNGSVASAVVGAGRVEVTLSCGPVLDEVVLRSYVLGAVHQAVGWVTSEGLAVDEDGIIHDLTIRSFGILRARQTPVVQVHLLDPRESAGASAVPTASGNGPTVACNGSDAVLAAVAAATWIHLGLPPSWPALSLDTHPRRLP